MNIYIAGCFESKQRLRLKRQMIQALGYTVVSTWLDEEQMTYAEVTATTALEFADRDLMEIASADLFILDTEDVNDRGGREVEFGWAYSFNEDSDKWGLPLWIVGPKRNIFHELADEVFEDWGQAIHRLRQMRECDTT